jgi:hypothetical protein
VRIALICPDQITSIAAQYEENKAPANRRPRFPCAIAHQARMTLQFKE